MIDLTVTKIGRTEGLSPSKAIIFTLIGSAIESLFDDAGVGNPRRLINESGFIFDHDDLQVVADVVAVIKYESFVGYTEDEDWIYWHWCHIFSFCLFSVNFYTILHI